jgi:signal transduction histidine kinase/CheY-like chemotaxis protein
VTPDALQQLLPYLMDAVALAFVALGVATAAGWLRRRDRSMGWLALAIVLLAAVVGEGRLQAHLPFKIPLLGGLSLIAFMGCAYAVLRYRDAIIPLPRRWHVAAIASLTAASAILLITQAVTTNKTVLTALAIVLVAIWCACVGEPIVRFWLVARSLPAVQAWRLRSLSLGFGGLIGVLLLAVSIGIAVRLPGIQVVIELIVLAIVPLLYASFAPPAWLRRQWRAEEEDGVRAFMEELLVSEDRDGLADRALEWSVRLVGGGAGVLFDAAGKPRTSRALSSRQIADLSRGLGRFPDGASRAVVDGAEAGLIALPVHGLAGSGTLVIVSGPFTPGFGGEEVSRAQQLMSAFVTALDRRHLIVQLEESNAALQEANKHKSVFLANMSHELRTPLNAIIGFSELLTDAREGQFDLATRTRFLSQILTSGKHLLNLINDILDLSKVVKTVEPLVAKKEIRIETRLDWGGEMLADAAKLKQMLLNLVSNAIKFTPEGGIVTIKSSRVRETVEISVVDTGIGIAEADHKEIFQEFHQVDHGPGRKHEGTGLGLALTKRFALLHGGDVRVTSEVDKGSVFTLSLPLRTNAVRPPAVAPAVQNGDAEGPLVLVVEDDPAAAELMTRQLAEAGYRTTVARTGAEALVMARQLQPAAITLDIILPEIDGWEVITRLKSDAMTSTIPVVVVSVVDNPELGLALGAIDYFVKPVEAKELIARLGRFNLRRPNGDGDVRVLVVDDEAGNRDWLARTLEPAGFTVLPAAGGREAIDLAKSQRPDLVLLDLMMPEVTGFDVVEALRADPSTRETPIMVLTAMNLTEADKRNLNGRVSEILSRGSLASTDIVGLLRRVIRQRNGSP